MYSLFNDSPASRADCVAVTGKHKFPKKFCQMQWVENVSVAMRAVKLLDDVKKVNQAKNLPETTTCSNVMVFSSDPLTV
jgi:hypothetical protein